MGVYLREFRIPRDVNDPSPYFLITKINDDRTKWELNLLCIEEKKMFNGITSERELRLKAAESPLNTFNVYLSDTLFAFGCEKDYSNKESKPSMHYGIKKISENKVLFEWLKEVSGMKVQLGEMEMHRKDFTASLVRILTLCLNDMLNAKRKIEELKSNVDQKEKERLEMKMALEEALERKASQETEMLSKFSKVLNSKKDKIRELYYEKECLEQSYTDSLKRIKKLEKRDPASTSSKRDTRTSSSLKGAAKPLDEDVNQPGPSRMRKKETEEDSLLLSSDEEIAVKPITRLRKRVCKRSTIESAGSEMEENQHAVNSSTDPSDEKKTRSDFSINADALFEDL